MASTTSRTVSYDGAYAPYGENYAETGTQDRSFTGQNQDTIASGSYPLYDFLMREYHPTWGRWLRPDPLSGSILNPQSLNRYAYVLNNPCSLTDVLGLQSCNLNITIADNGLLSPGQVAAAQVQARNLLAPAGVGVLFNQTTSEFTVTALPSDPSGQGNFSNTPPSYLYGFGLGGWGAPGNSAEIYVSETVSEVDGNGDLGAAVGSLVTHELSHFLFGSRFKGESYDVNNILSEGWDWRKMLNKNLGFPNPGAVHAACMQLHPGSSAAGSGGGELSGYGSISWFEEALGLNPGLFLGSGGGESVTVRIAGWSGAEAISVQMSYWNGSAWVPVAAH